MVFTRDLSPTMILEILLSDTAQVHKHLEIPTFQIHNIDNFHLDRLADHIHHGKLHNRYPQDPRA